MILTILLLLLALALVFFAQKLLFRRFWDRNLEVRIEFDREYVFCGEDANLTETIVNNKYGATNAGPVMASMVMCVLPVIILFAVFQKMIIGSLMLTGSKE